MTLVQRELSATVWNSLYEFIDPDTPPEVIEKLAEFLATEPLSHKTYPEAATMPPAAIAKDWPAHAGFARLVEKARTD